MKYILDKNLFIDENMYKAVMIYIDACFNTDTYYSYSESSKNAYWPSMKKLLTNVFSNQYLNDIDSKYVIELYNKEEKTNIKYFNRLFILLC